MKKFVFFLLMAVCSVVFGSCGKDDDISADVDLKSYIVGTWHSYRMTAYFNGQEKSLDITKNNEYSAGYLEMDFSSDGRVNISGWQVNQDGTSRWITDNGMYSVEGNTVHVRESVAEVNTEWNDGIAFNSSLGGMTRGGDDGEVISFVFDPSVMSLYVRYNTVINGVNVVGDLFLRK